MDRSVLFMKAVIKDSFDRYGTLIEDTEAAYGQAAKEVLPYTEPQMASMLPEERASTLEWYAEDYYKYAKDHPNLFRNALLTGYYSLLEHYTFRICAFLKKRGNLTIDANDLKGKGIAQAKDYLEKVCNKRITNISTWADVSAIKILRNCIVHELGIVKDQSRVLSFLNSHRALIGLDDRHRIIIKEGFLAEVGSTLYGFLESVLDRV